MRDLARAARDLRRIVLDQSKRAHVGHIGSALCLAELLVVLYGRVLREASPDDPDRDRFVLGKGHAALALYGALSLAGRLAPEQLDSYCADETLLGVHPEHHLPGVDFSTGSLGQGLTFAVGAALAARLQGSSRRVVALLSDAECNEGSVWEAAAFAAHHRLTNLLVVVDDNAQQALGRTAAVLAPSSLAERWRGFGWEVREVDGHDIEALEDVLGSPPGEGRPLVVVAHTVFGKGVSYMESQVKWHYWPMSPEEYAQAVAEVEGTA